MALVFDTRQPIASRSFGDIRSLAIHGIEICAIVSSFVFLFALVFGAL